MALFFDYSVGINTLFKFIQFLLEFKLTLVQIESIFLGRGNLFIEEFLFLEVLIMLILIPEELLLLLMALGIDLIALIFEPIAFSLAIENFLLEFHFVEVLVGGLLQFSVVRVDVIHFSLETIEEVLTVYVY